MTFGSLLITLGIFLLSVLYIIRPFFEEGGTLRQVSSGKFDSLLAERERLYSSIEDLDLEFDLEKISDKEHTRNRDLLLKQAAQVLMELDQLSGSKKKRPKPSESPVNEDDLEAMINARRRELKGEKTSSCSHCGNPVNPEDQFCGQCGEKL